MISDELEKARAVVPVLESLFVLMHTAGSHGAEHPMTRKAADAVAAAVAAAQPPLALQFVARGLFRDRVLVPIDAERYEKLEKLSAAIDNLSAHEVSFLKVPSQKVMASFGEALARGRIGPSDAMEHLRLEGLGWREIPAAERGIAGEDVEPEVFAAAQVTHAIAGAEELLAEPEGPWPWSNGAGVVRRLERALATHRETLNRALELAPGTWSVARRAVCASTHALALFQSAGATQATERAGAHAALALAIAGLRDRGGRTVSDAARRLRPRLLSAEVNARSGIEPHRLRVLAIVELLAEERNAGMEALRPVELAYLLERRRCPPKVDFVLTKGDLLAQAATSMGQTGDDAWVRLLIQTFGEVPPGAWVRLADGRVGTVLGPSSSGDPSRPQVLVGGLLEIPAEPVTMVPPPAALRRGR